MSDELGRKPTLVTKWDFFALLADTTAAILIDIANGFNILTQMFEHQASFVEEQKLFHDDVVRTIETIIEGE